ncbi:MAG TPA: sialidase family protein, partial [Lacunisphaera sp.]|nr:sialidase family protein [Lacunisphaera sp.]
IAKTPLFVAGEGDHAGYRIPAIVVTPQKTVLVATEARKHNRSDWGHIDLHYRLSRDSGRTWEPARVLVGQDDLPADLAPNAVKHGDAKPAGFTINNPTWIADTRNGRTLLLFCAEYLRAFIIESTNGGATFSKPREITRAFDTFRTRDGYSWRVLAIGPGHGIQTDSGRLVVPVWLSTGDGGNPHRPSVCATLTSDDGGVTWQAGEIVAGRPGDEVPNPSETVVVEAAPGRIMLNIRNESPRNRRAVAWSADGATGWSKPGFAEELWEPVCMGSLAKLPDGTLLFANPASLKPNPQRPQAANRQRENLGVRTSADQGRSWSTPLILEAGPSAYSDLAVAPDGSVLCFYEHGREGAYEKLSVARIPSASLPRHQP